MPTQPSRSAGRNPWWIPPFLLGRVPDIEPRLLTLLGFVGFALLFESYDYSLLNAALKYIAEDLSIPETDLGYFTALQRLGALPAFLLIPLADRIGRRRLFLVSVAGLSIGCALTAFSQSPMQFVAFQVLTRSCMISMSAVAFVMVTEEFPAAHRGWGIGILAAVAATGYGLGAGLFAAVDWLPYGWRALYAFGIAPLLFLPLFRRGVRETQRFEHHARAHSVAGGLRGALAGWFHPLLSIARTHPLRACGVALVASLAAFGHSVVFSFIGYFVLSYHGWAPFQYSLMVVLCGALGIPANVIAGRLADRVGRRAVGFVFLSVFPACAWLFFRGPEATLPVVWILIVFATMAGNVIVRALSTELFPTSNRGTSAGLMALMETLGAGAGLVAIGLLSRQTGDLISVVPLVALATLVSAFLLLLLPEASQRELETISREDPGSFARPPVPTASGAVEA